MNKVKPIERVKLDKLFSHCLLQEINSIEGCRVFMEHHVFAVWDFMSLAKKVQKIFAPIETPWHFSNNPKYVRFINEIILAEESDILKDGRIMSHCEMYLEAMEEIGASTHQFRKFLKSIKSHDISSMEVKQYVPSPAYEFMKQTFSVVNSSLPHIVTAGFCYGRENIIPGMFISLLNSKGISESIAPVFWEYLRKHIDLDGDIHGPMAVELTKFTCDNIQQRILEVEAIKLQMIQARINFWEGISESIKHRT
jgi:hypothetical protein